MEYVEEDEECCLLITLNDVEPSESRGSWRYPRANQVVSLPCIPKTTCMNSVWSRSRFKSSTMY